MTTLDQLRAIERRLMAATGPEQETDAMIFPFWNPDYFLRTDIPWQGEEFECASVCYFEHKNHREFLSMRACPRFTGSIDAVVAGIKRTMPEWSGYQLTILMEPERGETAAIVWVNKKGASTSSAPTPALALCLAWVRAMSAKEEAK